MCFKKIMQNEIRLLYKVRYWIWVLNGCLRRPLRLDVKHKVTVIIASYSEKRVKNLARTVRSILKCDFVESVVISNHNPEIIIEDWVDINDERVHLINQPKRRGSGYVWIVAKKLNPRYLISIDDDLLIFPSQLAILFQHLLKNPEIPHGLVGGIGSMHYTQKEMEVDILYEIYAVTGKHLRRYAELVEAITTKSNVTEKLIEYWGDDIVISHSGTLRPLIHDSGLTLIRCDTAGEFGVAVSARTEFQDRRKKIQKALEAVLR